MSKEYVKTLFDSSYVHRIEVKMKEGAWEELLETAIDKSWYKVSIKIDGEKFKKVRLRTKGSSSLRNVVAYAFYKDRYSYKLKFNKYDKTRTYHGLDKMLLNNNYKDPSCMRDVLAYGLFNRISAAAPLTSFAELYINGELIGLYLVVEANAQSYMDRTLDRNGIFCMPEAKILTESNRRKAKLIKAEGRTKEDPPAMVLPPFAPLYDTPGADLKYTDDAFESYSDIFENADSDIEDEDKRRLIRALKALGEGAVEQAVDCEQVIRYFAAHNFITSWDSYSWKMLHNYGLYEQDGRLSMVPWDYNLAFTWNVPAVTGAEDIWDSVVNMDIDNPGFEGVQGKDRPMWNWIVKDKKYLDRYHAVLSEEILPYFESGEFERDMKARHDLIRPYLEKDPTYNYSVEEFENSYQELIDFCMARTKSVRAQLSK